MYSYREIHWMEKVISEYEAENGVKVNEAVRERLADMKRELRAYNKRRDAKLSERGTIVREFGIDGFIVKFPLPARLTSFEAADEYFMETEYMECRPSMYDCTGQLFTSWYKIFRKPDGRFWCYHHISRDV